MKKLILATILIFALTINAFGITSQELIDTTKLLDHYTMNDESDDKEHNLHAWVIQVPGKEVVIVQTKPVTKAKLKAHFKLSYLKMLTSLNFCAGDMLRYQLFYFHDDYMDELFKFEFDKNEICK